MIMQNKDNIVPLLPVCFTRMVLERKSILSRWKALSCSTASSQWEILKQSGLFSRNNQVLCLNKAHPATDNIMFTGRVGRPLKRIINKPLKVH